MQPDLSSLPVGRGAYHATGVAEAGSGARHLPVFVKTMPPSGAQMRN